MTRMTLAALAIVATLGTAQAQSIDPYGDQARQELQQRVNEDRMRAIENRQFEDRMKYESDRFQDTQRRNADFYMSR